MMPILVKSDDVRSGRKAKAHQGWLGPAGSQRVNEVWLLSLGLRKVKQETTAFQITLFY